MKRGWGVPTIVALVISVAALAGILLAATVINNDRAAQTWLADRVGGSSIYELNITFARILPFLVALAAGFALFQRMLKKTADKIVGDWVTRHDTSSIVAHWVNVLGFLLALLTAAWMVKWLPRPVPTEGAYMLHFIGAALIIIAVVHHLVYHGVSGGRGLIPSSFQDVKQTWAETAGYAGVFSKQRAAFGIQLPMGLRRQAQAIVVKKFGLRPGEEDKYLSSEKVASYSVWAILIGILVITGTIKALRYSLGMPYPVLQAATFLHDGAMIWVYVQLFLHVAAVAIVPMNVPLLWSMFNGKIKKSYVQEHLTKWYARLSGNQAA